MEEGRDVRERETLCGVPIVWNGTRVFTAKQADGRHVHVKWRTMLHSRQGPRRVCLPGCEEARDEREEEEDEEETRDHGGWQW